MLCYGYYFRINTRYYYQNDVDGRTQWQYPTEESEHTPSPPMISNASTPPPPNISEQNSCHPEPVDMDIDEDNHKEDTEIIVVWITKIIVFAILFCIIIKLLFNSSHQSLGMNYHMN